MRHIYHFNKEGKIAYHTNDLPPEERGYVIDDTMPATWHPITGEWFNSKSAFRRVTKAHGCTEIGNDKLPPRKPYEPSVSERRQAFAESLRQTGILDRIRGA